MVYIYRKIIGNKHYYYLRASVRKGKRIIAKDIMFLGSDLHAVKDNLKNIPKIHKEDIRRTYRTINRFLESNTFLDRIMGEKIKRDVYLSEESLNGIEACRLHWNERFQKLDILSKEESLKQFIIEFAFNTTSIEGNTITLKQVQSLLMEQLTPKNKSLREIFDLQNTEKVFNKITSPQKVVFDHELIIDLHDSLLENIDSRKGYRSDDVRVFRSQFKSTPAPYVKADMELLLKWYGANRTLLHPFVLSVMFHHKLEKIHPFMDGNGRTGRMLMNYILLTYDYPPIIIYKKNRIPYLEKLHGADRVPLPKNDREKYAPLLEYAARELTDNYWNLFL
jgi:Fic family protein